MILYLAASSHHIPEARAVMQQLRDAGHRISHDWTADFDDVPLRDPSVYAARDLKAVEEAHALVYLHSNTVSAGAWCEFGHALALKKPVLAVAGRFDAALTAAVFLFAPGVYRYDDVEELVWDLDHSEAEKLCGPWWTGRTGPVQEVSQ